VHCTLFVKLIFKLFFKSKKSTLIVIGDLSAKKRVKTKIAQSILDTSFSALKRCSSINARTQEYGLKKSMKPIFPKTYLCCGSYYRSPEARTGLGIRE